MVLRYNSKLDNTFHKKFQIKWEGPFIVKEKFPNGTYQLADLDDTLHRARVNGYKLKKYYARLMAIVKDDVLVDGEGQGISDNEDKEEDWEVDIQSLFSTTADHE